MNFCAPDRARAWPTGAGRTGPAALGLALVTGLLSPAGPLAARPLDALRITRADWGTGPQGQRATLFTIRNHGAELALTDYGARMVAIRVPDRSGAMANVLVSADRADGFVQRMQPAGATMGRYAGRIAGGRFALDGKAYQLALNNNGNTLHGGPQGLDVKTWTGKIAGSGVDFTLTSPDGDMGFPGALAVRVRYELKVIARRYIVSITTSCITSADTVVNLTNHAFFNLSGRDWMPSDTRLSIDAGSVLDTNAGGLPTGLFNPVAQTPFDFRSARPISSPAPEKGYDATYVLRSANPARPAATVRDSVSGRTMRVYTSEPGLQLFAPRWPLSSGQGPTGFPYLSLEAQHFPDAPNHPAFPTTTLRRGQRLVSQARYEFSVEP